MGIGRKRKRKNKKPFSSRKQFADWLWLLVVKARADFTCEISGQDFSETVLNAHHLAGKSQNSLRYSLMNGICINQGIHKFDAHSTEYLRRKRFEDKVREIRGEGIYESLEELAKDEGYSIAENIEYLLEKVSEYRLQIEAFHSEKYQGKPEGKKYKYLFEQLDS